MKFSRQVRYYYLRFISLRGEPHELALGMAFGVFSGLMPIVPFQTALAVALAVFLKASKITAVLGTWVTNPLNWYFLYYYCYKLGAFILRIPEQKGVLASILESVHQTEEPMVLVGKIFGAGGYMIAAFIAGGIVLGLVFALPTYYIFLPFFKSVKTWRSSRKGKKH